MTKSTRRLTMTNKNETKSAVHLTVDTVKAAAPAEARYVLWDSKLAGFGLRVEPSGTKTFVFRYRHGGGRRGTLRQYRIGSAGEHLTPDQARKLAKDVSALVRQGKDPQKDRVEARDTLTVAELCDLYLAEGVSTKKDSTLSLDKLRIANHIKPLLGSRKITEVDRGDIERMLKDVVSGRVKAKVEAQRAQAADGEKTPASRARGGKAAASKSVKLLRAIFNFAIGRKLCTENPTFGVKLFADVRRELFLNDEEMGRLGDALAAAEASGADPRHVQIIRLLALTGARKNEIVRLRWSEVKGDYLQLEDSKTGRKAVHLGAAAQEVLQKVERTASPWVFPDKDDPSGPLRNIDWFWVVIRKRAGLDGLRIHDLRHSFASAGAAGGAPLLLIGKLLGHAHAATTQRYAHLSDNPAKTAADKIAASISAAMTKEPSENVAPLKRPI